MNQLLINRRSILYLWIAVIYMYSNVPIAEGKPWKKNNHQDFIYILYRPTQVYANTGYWNNNNLDHIALHGIGAGYEHSIHISHNKNLSLSFGANATLSTSAKKELVKKQDDTHPWYWEKADFRLVVFTTSIPCNIGYEFSGKKCSWKPYVGIEGTAHFWGIAHICTENPFQTTYSNVRLTQTDMWHTDTCNLFNVAYNLGIMVIFKKLNFGVSFSQDILPVYRSKNTHSKYQVRTINTELKFGYQL